MRILVVGSGPVLRRLVDALSAEHDVAAFDGDPRDRDTAARATAGVDTIVCGLPSVEADAPERSLDWASRGVFNLITTASSAQRFVLLSSLRQFERYPVEYAVTEYWAPRPTTEPEDLVPFVAEAVVREASHTLPLKAICLRLGAVHVDDAQHAVERALAFQAPENESATGWFVFHIVGADRRRFPLGLAGPRLGYAPAHPEHDVPARARVEPPTRQRFGDQRGGGARRLVIFGAGGPLAAITAPALAHDHVLRLCDVRPLAQIAAEGRPQSRGAPLPRVLDPPHEAREVDVTNYDQVLEATRGMDAVINMTVMRHDPVEAFRVNTLGAYNIIRAAVECGIRRVVQTGPQQVTNTMPAGYWSEVDLSSSVPPRPGVGLYFVSKFLGQEIMRVFALEHDLEVPTLLFGLFTNPDDCEPDQLGCYPFMVSWADAAEAVRGALRAPSFARPYEVFNIVADLPHGRYRTDRAKEALHWQPRDRLDVHWRRR